MPLFWFMAGILTTVAVLALLSPWLRTLSQLGALTSTPLRACVSAGVLVATLAGLYEGLGRPHQDERSPPSLATAVPSPTGAAGAPPTTPFGLAAKTFGDATGPSGAGPAAPTAKSAGSMDSAVASLEARLAKGGGTPGDWELLAKSFEFLKRPDDAAKARAHQLPAAGGASGGAPGIGLPAASTAISLSGEVTIDDAIGGKAAAGDTLFILAKSVESPGAPVAVIRTSVGKWPLTFTLDDSQSMMPGRTLSTAGRVIIEARISKKGQPLAAPGDLQGSSGAIDPAAHQPLRIKIDRVIG